MNLAGKPFGLGLRLSNDAAMSLSDPQRISEFNEFLAKNNLYVFTTNAFPYGTFHGERIKENVYLPDWRYTAIWKQVMMCWNSLPGL